MVLHELNVHLIKFLHNVQQSYFYVFITYYIGMFPIGGAILWVSTSFFYYFNKEKEQNKHEPILTSYPKVSILIAAFNEEKYLEEALNSLCVLDYPDYEIVIINDGSKDKTLDILEAYAQKYPIRIITKNTQQGKAIALNDALICLNGEIILFTDADVKLAPNILRYMVEHFQNARVAAVAGNPRIRNATNFLSRMQVLEYASIIGSIRRSQRIWGRVMTFSGVIFAARKSAVFSVGGFNPAAATEDIELTWKLQRRFWDIFYEPRAVAWTLAPHSYRDFFKQRLRWAKGLMYVIHENIDLLFKWKLRRMWPVIIENLLSQIWTLSAVCLFILWVLSFLTGYILYISFWPPLAWGVTIAITNIISQWICIWMDATYDPQMKNYIFYSVYFPLYYWLLITTVAFIELPRLIFKPKPTIGWKMNR